MQLADPILCARAVFISDLHLGSPEARPRELAAFLATLKVDRLYLVGDIVDLYWMRRRRMRWGVHEDAVIVALRGLVAAGTRIVYVPGNHDASVRRLAGLWLPGVQIRRQHVHRLADGRRLWITHGDQFDGAIRGAVWMHWLGDQVYRGLLGLENINRWWSRWRGKPPRSVAAWLKRQSTPAQKYIARFVAAVSSETARRGFDGVVCGHIHRPALRQVGRVLYANDGDWVENLSALVETRAGELKLVHWRGLLLELAPAELAATPTAAIGLP